MGNEKKGKERHCVVSGGRQSSIKVSSHGNMWLKRDGVEWYKGSMRGMRNDMIELVVSNLQHSIKKTITTQFNSIQSPATTYKIK